MGVSYLQSWHSIVRCTLWDKPTILLHKQSVVLFPQIGFLMLFGGGGVVYMCLILTRPQSCLVTPTCMSHWNNIVIMITSWYWTRHTSISTIQPAVDCRIVVPYMLLPYIRYWWPKLCQKIVPMLVWVKMWGFGRYLYCMTLWHGTSCYLISHYSIEPWGGTANIIMRWHFKIVCSQTGRIRRQRKCFRGLGIHTYI